MTARRPTTPTRRARWVWPAVVLLALLPWIWLAFNQTLWQRWGMVYWPSDRGLPSLSNEAMQAANKQVVAWPGFRSASLCQQTFDALEIAEQRTPLLIAAFRRQDPDNALALVAATTEWLRRLVPTEGALTPESAMAAHRVLADELTALASKPRAELYLEERWQVRYRAATEQGALPFAAARFADAGLFTSYAPVLRDWTACLDRLGAALLAGGHADEAADCHQAVATVAGKLAQSTEQPQAVLLAADMLQAAAQGVADVHAAENDQAEAAAWQACADRARTLRHRLRQELEQRPVDPLRYDAQPTTRPRLCARLFSNLTRSFVCWIAAICGLAAVLVCAIGQVLTRRAHRPPSTLPMSFAWFIVGGLALELIILVLLVEHPERPCSVGNVFDIVKRACLALPIIVAMLVLAAGRGGAPKGARWRGALIAATCFWLAGAWLGVACSHRFVAVQKTYEARVIADQPEQTSLLLGPDWRSQAFALPDAQPSKPPRSPESRSASP
jgi:hypothetical protein